MTLNELIEHLTEAKGGELTGDKGNCRVILSSDAEGNTFHDFEEATLQSFLAGELDENDEEGSENVIVLWPAHGGS